MAKTIEDVGEASPSERRRHPRVPVVMSAHAERVGRRAHSEIAETVDVSEAGVALLASAAFRIGDVVVVTLELGHDLVISCRGLVVGATAHGSGRYIANIAFGSMDDEALLPLRRLVLAHLPGSHE